MRRFLCLLPLLFLSMASGRAQSANGRTLFTFSGDANGFNPQGGLVQAPDGNFYGTTAGDIADGLSSGTIFRMTPDGTITTLHTFAPVTGGIAGTNADGAQPVATLMVGPDGNLYGTTEYGGANAQLYGGATTSDGTIFRMTLTGDFSMLYSFSISPTQSTTSQTGNPTAPLVMGSDGNVYGATSAGGDNPANIFRITPQLSISYFLQLPYFGGYGNPESLLEGSDGNFYFLYVNAGGGAVCPDPGTFYGVAPCGELFGFSNPPGDYWLAGDSFTILDNLLGPTAAGMVEGPGGTLFGTASAGDVNFVGDNVGSAFYVVPPGYNPLNFYSYGTGGSSSSLFLASDGNLYDLGNPDFFQLTPAGTLTNLFAPGASTLGAAIQAADGTFYGTATAGPTTAACGNAPCGSIYRVAMTSALDGPVQLTFGTSDIPVSTASPLTWKVSNAFSNTMQQCYLFSDENGVITALGKLTGTLTNNKFGGTVDVTPDSQVIDTYAVTCGGTESGFVNVRVGDAKATTAMGLTVTSPTTPGTVATLSAGPTTTQYVAPFTGTVTFSSGSLVLGTLSLIDGAASLKVETTDIPPGTYPVTATYSGDANYLPSTVTVSAIVGYSSTTAISADPTTVTQGQPVTLSAAVTREGAAGSPTGAVTFDSGTTELGTASLSGGTATFTVDTRTSLAHGIYPVTATYSGDFTDGGSTSPITYLNVKAVTGTTLGVSPNPVTQDEAFTLTAQVAESYDSSTPTGSVTFTVGGNLIGTVTLDTSGAAVVSTAGYGIGTGTYSVTAVYSGDSSNATSSAVVDLTVQ